MKAFLLFLLLLPPFAAFAQVTLTGRVVEAGNKPVPYASVFLSNTTGGTSTDADGNFTLTNIKAGQYDLVVSFIGFDTHHQNLAVKNSPIALTPIVLTVKTNQLKEVTINGKPDPNRERDLETFLHEFLGRTPNADECKILNTDAIDLQYNAIDKTLTASSNGFIIVENKALGYKIHYQLTKFIKDYNNNTVYYEGPVWFEEMKGRPGEQRRWLQSRLDVYQGSCMHFLRNLFAGQFDQGWFQVFRLTRRPNLARPPDSLIRSRLHQFALGRQAHPEWRDSTTYWQAKMKLPKFFDFLAKQPLAITDYVKPTDKEDLKSIVFSDYLYLAVHHKQLETTGCNNCIVVGHPAITVIILTRGQAFFDNNGVFTDPSSAIFDGAWGIFGVADMLPVNYEPPAK